MSVLLILAFILITGRAINAEAAKSDKDVLLELKSFLQSSNPVNQGPYARWNETDKSPCRWRGIACDSLGRVTGVYLNDSTIAGKIFSNFSQLARLTHLDLSNNTIEGPVPAELNKCVNLQYLNLSHNIISGEMHLTGLTRLETLDVTLNRFEGEIRANFPALCASLVTLNISMNNFTGEITGCFDKCMELKFVDLSSNRFSGDIWRGFERLQEFSVAENNLGGIIGPETFSSNCRLRVLDLSANGLRVQGSFPNSISNCSSLAVLNLWGNFFTGGIPSGIGSLSNLTTLILGNNSFDSEIPEQLLDCPKLVFIDLSRNKFSGDIQPIFGKFTTLKFLLLHSNDYTGGVESSGILSLPNLVRLDLSFNNLSGTLPVEVSRMPKLKFLVLAHNSFYGEIPPEYGGMSSLQALDLSFNDLSGEIPSTVGNLSSLLWLMLANNRLTGEIPTEIGSCRSLLWLNLANNSLSGSVPASISEIGTDPEPTFEANRRDDVIVPAASGECLAMKRWIPASYPPFSFVYTLMTRKTCRTTWDKLMKGYGVFPICSNSSSPIRTLTISGYLQLSSNEFSGEIPPEIGKMKRLSLIHIDGNGFSGRLPLEIGDLPLVVLNVSNNRFSGEIPPVIGGIKCLQSLDLSYNNFSGDFAASLNQLSDLNNFNVSYNPLLSGEIPNSGQMSTFGDDSFLGDPLVVLVGGKPPPAKVVAGRRRDMPVSFRILVAVALAFFVFGGVSLVLCLSGRVQVDQDPDPDGPFLDGGKRKSDVESLSPSTSDNAVKVYRLDTTMFTYLDIVTATRNFSDDMVIGRGGYGVVYCGVLPDGRRVAVKKLERMGWEGEREFRAEMEALTGQSGSEWPHPNLVVLYGWCLFGSEKLLVYDYMEGGSLDEVITDWGRFGWERRLETAIGVARALAFLHHECRPAIVHRDVKASNVLLDQRGRARVTDFGLSRIVGPGESHVSTMVAGTVGYVAPEYGYTCKATTKGDVYSFGVLAMELATGRRALDGGEECLVEWVRRAGIREVIGSVTVKETKTTIQMWGLMKIAMWCTAEAPNMRPDMREVLAMLLSISPYYDSRSCSSRSSDDGGSSIS